MAESGASVARLRVLIAIAATASVLVVLALVLGSEHTSNLAERAARPGQGTADGAAESPEGSEPTGADDHVPNLAGQAQPTAAPGTTLPAVIVIPLVCAAGLLVLGRQTRRGRRLLGHRGDGST